MNSASFVLERVTQPDIEPVTLAEMIQHVREFTSISAASQTELSKLITASREWVEDYTGRALIDQTWKLTIQGRSGGYAGGDIVGGTRDVALPAGYGYYQGLWTWGKPGEISLRKGPVLAITAFALVNADGTETAISSSTYELREAKSKWPRIVALNGATWSNWLTGDLRITFRAGFADRLGSPQQGAEMVPERFKQALKLWGEANYDRDPVLMQKLLDAAERVIKFERRDIQFA